MKEILLIFFGDERVCFSSLFACKEKRDTFGRF